MTYPYLPGSGSDVFKGVSVFAGGAPRTFVRAALCDAIVKTYFAHPLAWSQTGYNGPSSPRGHVRKWIGGVDPWEAHERTTLWDTA